MPAPRPAPGRQAGCGPAASGGMPDGQRVALGVRGDHSAAGGAATAHGPDRAEPSPRDPEPCPPERPSRPAPRARSKPFRRSRSAADGGSGQLAKLAPAAWPAPRRASAGGSTSSTVAPRIITAALPGRAATPGRRRAAEAGHADEAGDRRRSERAVRAANGRSMCRVISGAASPPDRERQPHVDQPRQGSSGPLDQGPCRAPRSRRDGRAG